MKGPQVSSFAMTYRTQMTGELGFTRQEGYELWAIFAEQVVRCFGPTHEEVKVLREMMKVRHKGDIDKLLVEIETWNVKAPTLAHEPPAKSDATPPSSPDVGTKGHQQSPG